MKSVRSSKRAFTFIELITVTITASIIMLTAGSIMVSQIIYFRQFMSEVKLQQEALFIIDSLKNAMAGSEHVDILGTFPTQTLETYNITTPNRTDAFILSLSPSGTTLTHNTYKADGITINTTEMVSNYTGSLTFSDETNPSNTSTIRLLKVDLKTSDPSVKSASGPHIVTALSCRLTPAFANVVKNMGNSTPRPGFPRFYSTIQAAINDPDLQPGDEIRCKGDMRNGGGTFDGVFRENVAITDKIVTLHGSYDDNFASQKFNGANSTPTTINGFIACSTLNGITSITIDRFIIQNGENSNGGGIHVHHPSASNNSLSVAITGNTIQNNSATGNGGGISVDSTSPDYANVDVTITGNTIINNNATGDGGGISFAFPGLSCVVSSVITNNTITGNTATTGNGGGISFNINAQKGGFNSIIANNNIAGNSFSSRGGGISIAAFGWQFGSPTSFMIANNIIASNLPSSTVMPPAGSAGGGISIDIPSSSGNVITTVMNNSVGSNRANCGGGLYCTTNIPSNMTSWNTTEDIIIRNNSITGNSASGTGQYLSGGGIYITNVGTSNPNSIDKFTICNNSITNNNATGGTAASQGGGIYADFRDIRLDCFIGNNIIATNSADSGGGGIWCDYFCATNFIHEFYIYNNVIAGNKTIKNVNDFVNFGGGGMYYKSTQAGNSHAYIINNTVVNNTDASSQGGGIFMPQYYNHGHSLVYHYDVMNTISFYNTPNNFSSSLPHDSVTYSDIGDSSSYAPPPPTHPPFNIYQSPIFADTAYHLSSSVNSYIIDGGNPSLDVTNPDGTTSIDADNQPPGLGSSTTDMGAYGGHNAVTTLGYVLPATDETSTPDIKENILGTY